MRYEPAGLWAVRDGLGREWFRYVTRNCTGKGTGCRQIAVARCVPDMRMLVSVLVIDRTADVSAAVRDEFVGNGPSVWLWAEDRMPSRIHFADSPPRSAQLWPLGPVAEIASAARTGAPLDPDDDPAASGGELVARCPGCERPWSAGPESAILRLAARGLRELKPIRLPLIPVAD